MMDVLDRKLPKSLKVDAISKPNLRCRIGMHDWRWQERFGEFGYNQYQARNCACCGKFGWVKMGLSIRG